MINSLLYILLVVAQAWITAPANNQLMEPQTDREFIPGSAASQCINLNPTTEYQTIDGFGWMLTEGSAKLLKGIHSAKRAEILRELYDIEQGHGAQIVRIAIGACDLSESDYTYSPARDESLSNFSLAGPDAEYLIPVLKEIIAIHPNIKILATPWTAPIWMKTQQSYVGGELRKQYYQTYADYLVRYLEAMKNEGIHIWAITPQNEPLHGGNNPSMVFSSDTEYEFVHHYLGPTLAANGWGDVKIIGYDHNCDVTDFPIRVAQSSYVSGSAFHLYGGDVSAMKTVWQQTGKDVYFTEQYTGSSGSFVGDYNWHMQHVMLGSLQNMSRCAIEWNLASDANLGPHTDGGCTTCLGAITVGNKVTARNVSYYIVASMAHVCRTGAKRIATSGADRFQVVAMRNPDGSIGVVARNKNQSSQSLSIQLNDRLCTYTVPGEGVISVLIPQATNPFDTALEQHDVEISEPSAPACTILGETVDADYHGIVIQNGKKYIKY